MEEASYLCDRLLVIDGGNILVQGTPDELVERYVGAEVVELRPLQPEKVHLTESLRGKGLEVEDRGDSVVVYQQNGQGVPDDLDLSSHRYIRRPGNLEDMFLRMTGRGLREE